MLINMNKASVLFLQQTVTYIINVDRIFDQYHLTHRWNRCKKIFKGTSKYSQLDYNILSEIVVLMQYTQKKKNKEWLNLMHLHQIAHTLHQQNVKKVF